MLFEVCSYEEGIYKRLEETVWEYMDEDMTSKFVPHLKKALTNELEARRDRLAAVESIVTQLFPGEADAPTELPE